MDTGEMVHLNPVPDSLDATDMSFLGEKLDKATATKIAQGTLHPCTRKPIVDIYAQPGHDNKENLPVRRLTYLSPCLFISILSFLIRYFIVAWITNALPK
jgi:hypothetical protein